MNEYNNMPKDEHSEEEILLNGECLDSRLLFAFRTNNGVILIEL